MNIAAISHRSTFAYCYAYDRDTVILKLKTGKDIEKAYIYYNDPFSNALLRKKRWKGKKAEMKPDKELRDHYVWSISIKPPYKRLQYYFSIEAEGKTYTIFENRICEEKDEDNISRQYFKFPWINPADIISPPDWVKSTVWYQIMPDRFRKGDIANQPERYPWGKRPFMPRSIVYGGNLKGVTEKLDYIKDLGIGGIYFTPINKAGSYHRYNTFDYEKIDPDLGTEDDIKELVDKAHKLGMKIMLDGVFNHCGKEFFAWKDVLENKKASQYYDWFFINDEDFIKPRFDTADGRYFTFSFWSGMPKLNTNNPEVIDYFTRVCTHWVRDWDIDGIRFDVGDEVSHKLIRSLNQSLKAIKPDLFLLGEIWYDSIDWLGGTEYDSVMNYPLSNCINDFFRNKSLDSDEFRYEVNYCLTAYPHQTAQVMFNFLDTHDTARVFESCDGKTEILLQKLALMLMLPGTPCIYYGTELAMKGAFDPDNRRCMPWDEIETGKYDSIIAEVSELIGIRNKYADVCSGDTELIPCGSHPRVIHCIKTSETTDRKIGIIVNADKKDFKITDCKRILFSSLFEDGVLHENGTVIYEIEK